MTMRAECRGGEGRGGEGPRLSRSSRGTGNQKRAVCTSCVCKSYRNVQFNGKTHTARQNVEKEMMPCNVKREKRKRGEKKKRRV